MALAEVRRVRGETTEADAAINSAIEIHQQKGNIADAARLRAARDAAI